MVMTKTLKYSHKKTCGVEKLTENAEKYDTIISDKKTPLTFDDMYKERQITKQNHKSERINKLFMNAF
jgi:hypothetical protein